MSTDTIDPRKRRKARKGPPAPPSLSDEVAGMNPEDRPARKFPVPKYESVKLDDITVEDSQDRDEGRDVEDRVDDLANSLLMSGQLQPVGINLKDGKHELIWGHLRRLAAMKIGWSTLDAKVYENLTDDQVRELRLIENAQRTDLTPVEEAVSVAALLDLEEMGHTQQPFSERNAPDRRTSVRNVAAKLGKTQSWVWDRAYLAKLQGKTRQLVLDGLLPLGHAREIAKVIDPATQDEIARAVAATEKGDTPADLSEVKRLCARHLYSLAQVAWKLTEPFADKPACVDCPHNSVNRPNLFQHGTAASADAAEGRRSHAGSVTREPAAGICTNASCYLDKTRAASAQLGAAAKKAANLIEEAPKKKRARLEKDVVGQVTPAGIQPKAVAARLKARMERVASHRPSAKSDYKPTPTASQKRADAERKFAEAMRERAKQLEPKIAAALQRVPGGWALLVLLTHHSKLYQAGQGMSPKSLRSAQSAGLKALIKHLEEPSWEGLLAIEKDCGRQYGLIDFWQDGPSGLVEQLAYAVGVKLDEEPPTLEDFLGKGGGEE